VNDAIYFNNLEKFKLVLTGAAVVKIMIPFTLPSDHN
jgi:hypothetical protein